MAANLNRGVTRIWVVVVALAEIILLLLAVSIFWDWYSENPFNQFDEGYVTLWQRLLPVVIWLIGIPIAAFAIWLAGRWIARGFSN